MYGTKTVYREQKDSSGTSIGMDKHVEATVEGRYEVEQLAWRGLAFHLS